MRNFHIDTRSLSSKIDVYLEHHLEGFLTIHLNFICKSER